MFAVSQPGMEGVTARELRKLGLAGIVHEGGVDFKGSMADLYRSSLWLRSANRILVRVGRFRIRELSEVAQRFSRYPWELYGIGRRNSGVLKLRVTSHRSRLYHTGAVAQRALRGIEKRTGPVKTRGCENRVPLLVVVRLVMDMCTVSVDSSGLPLHMRGYRIKGVKAPLRENLAAGLLIMSGWKSHMPILDPFCGSGTIAIEAAMISCGMAVGAGREFAFMKWRNFDIPLWHLLHEQAVNSRTKPAVEIFARDCDSGALEATEVNAEAAGVSDIVHCKYEVFRRSAVPPVPRGWIVTNPPYGRRLSRRYRQKENIYGEIGMAMNGNFQEWGITCLLPSGKKSMLSGMEVQHLSTFWNGGFKVDVVQSLMQW